MAGYDDGRVTCTDSGIVLHRYYLLRPKHISYQEIREARQVPLTPGRKLRRHGSGDMVHWFSYDPDRDVKDAALVLYLDQKYRPVLTPDDPAQVAAELQEHGVTVTSGDEEGLYEKQWGELSTRTRRLIITTGVTQAGLLVATLIDIKRRPASQIRGTKRMWTGLAFVNLIGPACYFLFGRRRHR